MRDMVAKNRVELLVATVQNDEWSVTRQIGMKARDHWPIINRNVTVRRRREERQTACASSNQSRVDL